MQVPELDMGLQRAYFGLERLEDKLYVIGGFDQKHNLNTCNTLDLRTHIWEYVEEMHHQR